MKWSQLNNMILKYDECAQICPRVCYHGMDTQAWCWFEENLPVIVWLSSFLLPFFLPQTSLLYICRHRLGYIQSWNPNYLTSHTIMYPVLPVLLIWPILYSYLLMMVNKFNIITWCVDTFNVCSVIKMTSCLVAN